VVGVDFGSANSLVATVEADGPMLVLNDVGDVATPSCVYIPGDLESSSSTIQFGKMALSAALTEPNHFYSG